MTTGRSKILVILFLLWLSTPPFSPGVERFPKPDFQTPYARPELATYPARAPALEYVDAAVLLIALSLASFFAIKLRSRRKLFLTMIFCLVYFGFYRKGCICSIGAMQNVFYALFDAHYIIPYTAIVFFIAPLVFTLFFGRTFCAAVCPLGAVQDVVILHPVHVPARLTKILSIFPYIYFALAALFAACGAGFIICRYDPFVGFFRSGAAFDMVVLGISLLLLGTVIARPYCRFICPYGVLLNWLSRLSWRHVTISPNECNNCRLCEESCPFDAIERPVDAALPAEKRVSEIKRLALVFILLPVIVIGGGWATARLFVPLSRQHFTVSLAEEILLEDSGKQGETSERTRTFRASGKPTEELFSEAAAIRRKFKIGGWFSGGFLGLVFSLKLIALFIRKKRVLYAIDAGSCLSCGRCFLYCPFERVRLEG